MQSRQHMTTTQKGLVLMMLVISYGSFAMDTIPECNLDETALFGEQKAREEIVNAGRDFFIRARDFGISTFKTLQKKAKDHLWNQQEVTESSFTINSGEATNSESASSTDAQETEVKVDDSIDNPVPAPVSVTWLNKKTALKFGIGAVALITIGATTYILYKNGTFKKLVNDAKKHPFISAGTASIITSVCGYLAYKYHMA